MIQQEGRRGDSTEEADPTSKRKSVSTKTGSLLTDAYKNQSRLFSPLKRHLLRDVACVAGAKRGGRGGGRKAGKRGKGMESLL